jgi:hypothetical protein
MMVLETDQGSVTRTRRAVKPRDCAASESTNAHTCLLFQVVKTCPPL